MHDMMAGYVVTVGSRAVSIPFISRTPKSDILTIAIFLYGNRFRFGFLGMRFSVF